MINYRGIFAIYRSEVHRGLRAVLETILSPVLSTLLYFVVFGVAIGDRIGNIDGVEYGSFIVPGLIMSTLLATSTSNAGFGIYFPRFTGTIYEVLSAPLSPLEITVGYVCGAATKSIVIAFIILFTSTFFTNFAIEHPLWMIFFLVISCITFSMMGFIIGIWADNFEQLSMIPLLVLTPLTFLGGSFYSIDMLPEFWQKVSLLNPVVYLISALRWSFYGTSAVDLEVCVVMIISFLIICMCIIVWIFRTGYRLKK